MTNRSTVREAGESGAWVGSACAEWRGDGRGEVGLNACTYIRMYIHGHMHARTHTHTHLSTHSHHFPHYTKLKLGLPTRHRNTEIANLTCAHHPTPPPPHPLTCCCTRMSDQVLCSFRHAPCVVVGVEGGHQELPDV